MKALSNKNGTLWLGMLCGVLFDLLLIGLSLLMYPSLLEAGRASTALGCVPLLLLYGCFGIVIPSRASQAVTAALWQGTAVGLIVGVIFVIDLTVEYFVDMGSQASALSTLGFMALIFFLFGLSGARGIQKTGQLHLGVLSGVWSAMIGVMIAVFFGFVMNFFFMQRLEHILYADYASSGMNDPRAFTFFNSLDSAFSHLLEAPILAVVFGTCGALLMKEIAFLRVQRSVAMRQRL